MFAVFFINMYIHVYSTGVSLGSMEIRFCMVCASKWKEGAVIMWCGLTLRNEMVLLMK